VIEFLINDYKFTFNLHTSPSSGKEFVADTVEKKEFAKNLMGGVV
jgi:hypothetical protein